MAVVFTNYKFYKIYHIYKFNKLTFTSSEEIIFT